MINIYDVVDNALSRAVDDYYHGMPEFEEGEEPSIFATYTVQEAPENFAEGEPDTMRYAVYVNLFAPYVDEALKNKVIAAMKQSGGCYMGGRDNGNDTGYPSKKQKSLDFVFSILK